MNKVILVGNVGKDPEVRYLPDGTACANFSIATSEKWKDKNTGEKRESTEWHNVVAWRRLAEIVGEYVTKGSKLLVEGKLQTRSWDKNDGTKGYKTEIVINNMEMLGGNRAPQQGNQGYSQAPQQQAPPAAPQQAPPAAPPAASPPGGGYQNNMNQQPTRYPGDDDIPF